MKKIFSLLLVLAMVFTMAPAAFAADPVATDGTNNYDTLKAAFDGAADGATITLLKDCDVTEPITVAAGKTLTLDLNGFTAEMVWSSNVSDNHSMVWVYGNLTVKDSSGTNAGTLKYQYTGADTNFSKSTNTITCRPGSTFTLLSGTIKNLTTANGIAYAIDALTNHGNGDVTVNINGGKTSSEKTAVRLALNSDTCTGTLNITAGEFYGRVQIHDGTAKANKGVMNISGGKFTPNTDKSQSVYIYGHTDVSNISVSITNGDFEGTIESVNAAASGEVVDEFISGGNFAAAPDSTYLASGTGNVVTTPSGVSHIHTLEKKDAIPATCTAGGTIEYYYCEECADADWYYINAAGTTYIAGADLAVPAAGHQGDGWFNSDAAAHWEKCAVCGVNLEFLGHGDANGDGYCDTCGWIMNTPAGRQNPSTGVSFGLPCR